MPKVKANDITINYESQGIGRAAGAHPLSCRRQCLLRLPGRRLRQAFHLHFARSARRGRERQAGRGLFDRIVRRRRRRLHGRDRRRERACERAVAGRARSACGSPANIPSGSNRCRSTPAGRRADPFLKVVVGGWQTIAKGLGSVPEMIIQGIFPWCFTPELYAAKPDYIDQLAAFVRSRPKQPLDAFLRQSDAVIAHDALAQLGKITAPTQITFGRHDHRDLDPLRRAVQERHQEQRTRHIRELRPRPDL